MFSNTVYEINDVANWVLLAVVFVFLVAIWVPRAQAYLRKRSVQVTHAAVWTLFTINIIIDSTRSDLPGWDRGILLFLIIVAAWVTGASWGKVLRGSQDADKDVRV